MRDSRVLIDAELASFHLSFWSPDGEFDSVFTADVARFDQHGLETNMRESVVGAVELECRRLVRVYFPQPIDLRDFRITYDRSVTVSFSLIWVGAVSLYVLVSRYDNFRRSLDRLKDDVSRFLGRTGRRSHRPGPLVADTDWTPGRLFVELEELFTARGTTRGRVGADVFFLLYLIVTNIALSAVVAVLVYRAVAFTYFR